MCKVLKKLSPVSFIASKQFNFGASLHCPFFYVFPNIINTFLRKDIFIIHLFLLTCFCLIDEFINEFDLPVNKTFKYVKDQKITSDENNNKSENGKNNTRTNQQKPKPYRNRQYQCCKK